MACFEEEPIDVHCGWDLAGAQQNARSRVIVIVDVLSSSTIVDVARSASSKAAQRRSIGR